MGEQFGTGVARSKPKRKIVKGITPANIQQAGALQFSFAALPQGKAAGKNVMAKDMGEALNEIDVIDFDTEEVDEVKMDDDTPAQEAFKETLKQDKVLLGTLWARLQSNEAMVRKGHLQMDYMIFQLQSAGFPYGQTQVEETLGRWLNDRPGRDVKVQDIRELF